MALIHREIYVGCAERQDDSWNVVSIHRSSDIVRVGPLQAWVFAIACSFNWMSVWIYICVLSIDSWPSQSAITVRFHAVVGVTAWPRCDAALELPDR
jgi:hypothetical protein